MSDVIITDAISQARQLRYDAQMRSARTGESPAQARQAILEGKPEQAQGEDHGTAEQHPGSG